MIDPVGVILAGGLSRRMGGGDKALLSLAGTPLLEHVIARLAPQLGTIILNANGDATRFVRFGLPVVADSIDGFAGPLAGVLAGLDWAAERGAGAIVTVAADTPFFPRDLVARLTDVARTKKAEIVLAATDEADEKRSRHPTFGLWPVNLREDLRAALGEGTRKVVAWTDRHDCAAARFSAHPANPFFNVNTPDDLARAGQIMAKENA